MTHLEKIGMAHLATELTMAAAIFEKSSKPWTDKDKDQPSALNFANDTIIKVSDALKEAIDDGQHNKLEVIGLRAIDDLIWKADNHFCLATNQDLSEQLRFEGFYKAGYVLKAAAAILANGSTDQAPAESTTCSDETVFVVRSVSEQGYWSNEDGWVADTESATKYNQGNKPYEAYLPFSGENDAEIVVADGLEDFGIDSDIAPS